MQICKTARGAGNKGEVERNATPFQIEKIFINRYHDNGWTISASISSDGSTAGKLIAISGMILSTAVLTGFPF